MFSFVQNEIGNLLIIIYTVLIENYTHSGVKTNLRRNHARELVSYRRIRDPGLRLKRPCRKLCNPRMTRELMLKHMKITSR